VKVKKTPSVITKRKSTFRAIPLQGQKSAVSPLSPVKQMTSAGISGDSQRKGSLIKKKL